MWLQRLRVAAFGALRDQTLELAPGLNVVHGPNESAKSTWHAALTVGLCGRRRGAGRRNDDAAFEARHRPWDNGDAWALALDLVLDDGRRIEIDRDLANNRAAVGDLGCGGRPVEDDLVRDGSPDGAVWLGLDRATFPATASVRQAELLAVTDHADGLRDHLARAATGGTRQTAAAAIERLLAFQKDAVGIDRVSAVKPLRRAIDAVAAAEQRLDEVRTRHGEYHHLVLELQQARRQAEAADERVREATAAAQLHRLDAAEARVAELERRAAEFPDGEPSAGEDPGAAELARVVERFRSLPPEPSTRLPEAARIEAEMASLPPAPVGPLEIPASVHDSLARHRSAGERLRQLERTVVAPSAPDVEPGEAQVWVEALRREPPPSLADAEAVFDMARHTESERERQIVRRRQASIGGWLVVVAGLAAVAVGPSLVRAIGVTVVVCAAFGAWVLGRRSLSEPADLAAIQRDLDELASRHRIHADSVDRATRSLVDAGLPLGDAALEAAVARHVEWSAHRVAQQGVEEARTEAADCRRLALVALADVGIEAQEPDQGVEELARVVEATKIEASEAARRNSLADDLDRRRTFDQELADHRRTADHIVEAVVYAGGSHDLHGSPDQIADGLEAILAEWEETARQLRGRHERWGALRSALGGADLDEHRDQLRAMRADVDDACAGFDRETLARIADPDAALRSAPAAAREATERAERCGGALQQVDLVSVDVGAAEAELESARTELDRVERLRDTLETTRSFLTAAHHHAHRALAPRLEREMTRWVPVVTAGRYVEAQVDPETLAVRVRSRDGQARDAALLSHGTAEQIHLALRIVLAQLLTSDGERCPVLLDDPTVHADPERTLEILEWLQEVSRDHQVIVFSQEAQVAEWSTERLDPDIDAFVGLVDTGSASDGHPDLTQR